jgi:hypothetical protein
MSTLIELAVVALILYGVLSLERRVMDDLIEEDRRKEEEHQARLKQIRGGLVVVNGWVLPASTIYVGQRSGLRGLTSLVKILPAESWLHETAPEPVRKTKSRSPRPNRRRRAQKLRAARQRRSWHQVLVHEDENG